MAPVIMEAIGHNGQLELTETAVRIKRKGILSFLTQGLKGDKEILISQITSIQFKRAGLFVNGYIQFAFIGGQEAKGGTFQAASDENTVMFRQGQQAAFEDFKAEIERRINTSHNTVTKISSNLDEIE